MAAVLTVTGLTLSGTNALAQDSSAATTVQPVAANAPVPQLAYGVPQILQLAQAKVGDDTIIAYIKNAGNSYGLNADQIIYLRQQGVSDAVITTMLNQPRAGVTTATPATPASPPTLSADPVPPVTVAPAVTYVQTVPATSYYYQPYYYYPDYAWYPPVTFYVGGGVVWGGGWHGGWHGGVTGGGWHGSVPSGGWHGGGSIGGGHGGGSRR